MDDGMPHDVNSSFTAFICVGKCIIYDEVIVTQRHHYT
jgi:hypothetical protein